MGYDFRTVCGIVLCSVSAMALSACGGGGSGGGGVASTPTPISTPAPGSVSGPGSGSSTLPGRVISPDPVSTFPTPIVTPAPGVVGSPVLLAGITAITPKSEVAVRSANDDVEYRRNYAAFEYVRALYALDSGWTGQGVLVGVVDDGIFENVELEGQVSGLSKDFGSVTTNGITSTRNVIGDRYSDHGTMVAGVIAGLNNGSDIQGIASGSKLVALRVSDTNTNTGVETIGGALPSALAYAASQGIKIVNVSLAKVDASQQSPEWSDMVSRYTSVGGLFVNSAGNGSGANASGYLDLNTTNRDGWLFVTAVEEADNGIKLGDYANRCGSVAMARCISAMGTNATIDVDGNLVWFEGTSSATAQVSGLAALILSKWPQLSGVEAGQVILNTARDLGEKGIDVTFGAGLIDVQAALSPISPTISNGITQTSLGAARMVIPDAIGGAVTASSVKQMLSRVTVLDAYGRDFDGNFSSLVTHPARQKGAFARRVVFTAGAGASAFATKSISASVSYATIRGGPADAVRMVQPTSGTFMARIGNTNVIALYSGQDAIQNEAMGLAPASDVTTAYAPGANLAFGLERKIAGAQVSAMALNSTGTYGTVKGGVLAVKGHGIGLKVGYLNERGTLFGGSVGQGSLRFGNGARTAVVEASRQWDFGNWLIDSYASIGLTRLKLAPDTLLTSASFILTQRAGVSASTAAGGGCILLGAALPLTAVFGSAQLTYASHYDSITRALVHIQQRIGLTGNYAPVVSFGYERAGTRSSLRLAAASNSTQRDWSALAAWRLTLR